MRVNTTDGITVKNGETKVVTLERKKLMDIQKTPPKCVPLVSANPAYNPYHPLLTPKGSATREVKALPIKLGNSISCHQDQTCDIRYSKSFSISNSNSYSVSTGQTDTYSKVYGESITSDNTSSSTTIVSDMIERSSSFTNTTDDGGSDTSSAEDSLSNTFELQVGNSRTSTSEVNSNNSTTNDINAQINFEAEDNESLTEDERNEQLDRWGE
jgi:hypothetical protein